MSTYQIVHKDAVKNSWSRNNKLFLRLMCMLEPIMLKNLPIIPSQTSQNFYPLFLFYFYSIVSMII